MFAKGYLFNPQLCSGAVSIKFSHFSHSSSLSRSNRGKVNSAGMSRFLCGQTEMSELALEQNGWRRSNRSGKANELSDRCHTRWQTAADVWRLPASPTHPPAPMGPLRYPTWSLFELVCRKTLTHYTTIDHFSPDHRSVNWTETATAAAQTALKHSTNTNKCVKIQHPQALAASTGTFSAVSFCLKGNTLFGISFRVHLLY